MGIGDWAQSPIPNPQSPIPKSWESSELYLIININEFATSLSFSTESAVFSNRLSDFSKLI